MKRRRAKRQRNAKNRVVGCIGGFVKTRITADHMTLWVEGRDEDGRSVSGVGLQPDQLERLIVRLSNTLSELRRRAGN